MAFAGILRRSQTKQYAFDLAQVAAQRNGVFYGAFPFTERWTAAARAFSSKGSGSDVVGVDIGPINSSVAVMEGKKGELLVGPSAKSRALTNLVGTVFGTKHILGRTACLGGGIREISSGVFEVKATNSDTSMQNLTPKRNINRPLSPHLSVYKPQLTSTYSIFNRISAAFLSAVVLSSVLVCLEIGPLSLTYPNLYQASLFVNFPKLTLSLVNFTILALCYHTADGFRHIWWDLGFSMESFRKVRISEVVMLCVALLAFGKIIQTIYF